MYLCILDKEGEVLLHRNFNATPEAFLGAVAAFRDDLVVAVECIFTWYWLADLCAEEGIHFVLGHALYMKAIHGGKAKNDKIDAHKIAVLLRGGMLPQAYVYPKRMRATRDLLRRRNHLMRKRADLLAHIQNTASQYNLPPLGTRVDRKAERAGIPHHFPDPIVRRSIELDLSLIAHYDGLLKTLEQELALMAKDHDAFAYHLLRSIPGVGRILTLILLYEIEDVNRFPRVNEFLSYARLVKAQKSSAGKVHGHSGKKIGNVHLKWAFSEAAVLFLRQNPEGQRFVERLAKKHGKGKALSILAARLGRAVYLMLKRRKPFDRAKFFAHS
jgi:transposase